MLPGEVSEEVETATTSPVDVTVGLETPLAVTWSVSPASTVQPPPTVRVTVASLLLVTQLLTPDSSPS